MSRTTSSHSSNDIVSGKIDQRAQKDEREQPDAEGVGGAAVLRELFIVNSSLAAFVLDEAHVADALDLAYFSVVEVFELWFRDLIVLLQRKQKAR